MIGQTLGHYRILEKLGEGGMGVVYRARDQHLNRDIAIKVLPEAFARDPERLARFRREAQLLALLNHPNIAAIYGLEEADGLCYLVLEYVPGQTLAERVGAGLKPAPTPGRAQGPAPTVEEAVEICKQVAEGLEAAHGKGIIHRDLKPANVKVTPEGKVKVLDFGLAKAFEPESSEADLSKSPTISAAATRAGVILGTAAYMSPEQARGRPVDKGTDIWSFGCLLYEVVAGRPAFAAETISDTIAAILKNEPNWQALPQSATGKILGLLRRCLQKDLHRRLRDIGDARLELEEMMSAPATAEPMSAAAARAGSVWQRTIPWSVAGAMAVVAAVLAGVGLWNWKPSSGLPARSVTRFVVPLPPGERLVGLAVSPDGTHVAYVSRRAETRQLYVRSMDSLEARPIPGAEDATDPFFSPDGQWLGFFDQGKLKKVSVKGGAPVTLCDALGRGGSWGDNDTIIFAPLSRAGLWQVSAAGATPKILTTPDPAKGETSHRFPEVLPGSKAVLFSIEGKTREEMQIVVQSLETGQRRVLVQGVANAFVRYLPTGHLVYPQAGTLTAVPFDLARLELSGVPFPVVEGVWLGRFSVSSSGSLVYGPGHADGVEHRLVWVDRKGTARPLAAPPRPYRDPRLSPDGRRVVVAVGDPDRDVWVYDIARDTLTRLTFEARNFWPLWTPDGKRVTFSSNRLGPWALFWKPADGSVGEELLLAKEYNQIGESWSPDGQMLAFHETHPTTAMDIWVLPLQGERKPRPFLRTPFIEGAAAFSPDGRWLAYSSNESGRFEVYVKPVRGAGGPWQISTEGGREPVWARNGRELFFLNADKMMAVDIRTEPTFAPGKPRLLFEGQYVEASGRFRARYDVAPDSQRFLMVKQSEQTAAPTQLNVVLNWFEELKGRVPAGKK